MEPNSIQIEKEFVEDIDVSEEFKLKMVIKCSWGLSN